MDEITQLLILLLRESASCKFGEYNVRLRACEMYSAARMYRYLCLSNVVNAIANCLGFRFGAGVDLKEDAIVEHGKFSKAYIYLLRLASSTISRRKETVPYPEYFVTHRELTVGGH
jgi:hypothetical protein